MNESFCARGGGGVKEREGHFYFYLCDSATLKKHI